MGQARTFIGAGRQSTPTSDRPDTLGHFLPFQPVILQVSPQPHRLPNHLELGTLNDRRYRVVSPFLVRCARHGDRVTAEATELGEFGSGHTMAAAVHDLQLALIELYATLESEQHRLGPDLEAVWGTLRQKVTRGR
jgi:hypothetical protein